MHQLPADFDPSIFLGKTLELVSFSANTVHFAFADGPAITAMGSFQHTRPDETTPTAFEIGREPKDTAVPSLAGRAVASAAVEHGHTLRLVFDDASTLWISGGTEEYEDYTLSLSEREIVV
jgi:hypothetical protein